MKQQQISGVTNRYSEAFKLMLVTDIEKGKLTISEASRIYEINGTNTIYQWLRKYGKNHLIRKFVRIEMKDEKSIILELQAKVQELEQALSSVVVQNICYESYIESIDSRLSEEEKKTLFLSLSPEQRRALSRRKDA